MLRQVARLALLGLLLLACACSSAPQPPPTNYASFNATKGQWVIEVKGIDPTQTEKVRTAIEEVSGVEKGSALVHPVGQYVAFRTTVSTSDGKAHGAVRSDVEKKLEGLGLKPGESKTCL
ncbi:MAG: hypothetical protein U0746_15370 [Gemmataceae bacterium]